MAMIAGNTLRFGTTAGFLTVIGVEAGDACVLGAMLAGLVLSDELLGAVFRWLSLAGAIYLIWLAAEVLAIRHRNSRQAILSRSRKPILDGLTIVFANPSRLLFHTAFFPQFIDPDHPMSEQLVMLGALYVCTALAFEYSCVLTVARLRLPTGWARAGRVVELGSATVYLSVAVVTVFKFLEASA